MFWKQCRYRDDDRKNMTFLYAELHGPIFRTFGVALRGRLLKFLWIAGKQGKEKRNPVTYQSLHGWRIWFRACKQSPGFTDVNRNSLRFFKLWWVHLSEACLSPKSLSSHGLYTTLIWHSLLSLLKISSVRSKAWWTWGKRVASTKQMNYGFRFPH